MLEEGLFQSHNGAIAASDDAADRPIAVLFQSHNGAIAAYEHKVMSFFPPEVSIPQWCDCCWEVCCAPSHRA